MENIPLCSFCNNEEETPLHIFSESTFSIYLWQQLVTFFENNLILRPWSDDANHDEPIINHVLLLFYFVCLFVCIFNEILD